MRLRCLALLIGVNRQAGRPDEAARYLQGLGDCGWFEALPAGAAKAARDGVTASLAAGDKPWLGLVCASPLDPALAEELIHLQRDLFALGAQLADPADRLAARITKAVLGDQDVARLEQLIDGLEEELPPLRRRRR